MLAIAVKVSCSVLGWVPVTRSANLRNAASVGAKTRQLRVGVAGSCNQVGEQQNCSGQDVEVVPVVVEFVSASEREESGDRGAGPEAPVAPMCWAGATAAIATTAPTTAIHFRISGSSQTNFWVECGKGGGGLRPCPHI